MKNTLKKLPVLVVPFALGLAVARATSPRERPAEPQDVSFSADPESKKPRCAPPAANEGDAAKTPPSIDSTLMEASRARTRPMPDLPWPGQGSSGTAHSGKHPPHADAGDLHGMPRRQARPYVSEPFRGCLETRDSFPSHCGKRCPIRGGGPNANDLRIADRGRSVVAFARRGRHGQWRRLSLASFRETGEDAGFPRANRANPSARV